MTVRCRTLDEACGSAWDTFVLSHPQGTFFHRAAWRHVIAHAFRHTCYYLMAEQDGAISGVLPLVHVRTRLFGNGLVSVPFCVYGGPLASDTATAEALEREAITLMQKTGARFCEFRFRDSSGSTWSEGPALYETFRKRLPLSEEAVLQAIPRKQRAVVRKGILAGLSARVDRALDPFFHLYAESVRNHGTPVFPRSYFRVLLELFSDSAEVLSVEDAGRPISAVLCFSFRDEILPYYAGGGRDARGRGGHDFMYWEVMRRAVARGLSMFDFGRSKVGTGAHAFKRNWGFEPRPLHYRHILAPGARMPANNPLNPKYRLMIAAWKRMPLPVANLLGPHIVRGIG
ncbi:MAG: FemAB family XrtA/PEP-CTERM system-associated protein [Acetobacteraceae bacterium]